MMDELSLEERLSLKKEGNGVLIHFFFTDLIPQFKQLAQTIWD